MPDKHRRNTAPCRPVLATARRRRAVAGSRARGVPESCRAARPVSSSGERQQRQTKQREVACGSDAAGRRQHVACASAEWRPCRANIATPCRGVEWQAHGPSADHVRGGFLMRGRYGRMAPPGAYDTTTRAMHRPCRVRHQNTSARLPVGRCRCHR